MPLFFFHLRTPKGFERDDTGLECADLEAAYLEAYQSIPELSAEFFRHGRNPMEYVFEITDVMGTLLFEMPFTETLRERGRPPRPHPEGPHPLSQAERVHSLVTSVRQQVEQLQKEMRASREWLNSTRAALKR